MGTVRVKAWRPGAKPDVCLGYAGDERRYLGDEFEISDAPKVKIQQGTGPDGMDLEIPIPGTIAAFSDAKRKKGAGWMKFANPEDEKKYRSGGFNKDVKPRAVEAVMDTTFDEAAAEAKAVAAAAGKSPGKPGKSSGDKDVLA